MSRRRSALSGRSSDGVDAPASHSPTWGAALRAFLQIGVLSFGGPTAQISLMHRVLVDEKKWLGEREFLRALGFCMLLPGPEAMQLATYMGWRLHGFAGGLAAGLLFVGPGALIVLALAAIYALFGQAPLVEAVFFGVKAAVLAIVLQAMARIARRALTHKAHWGVAATSFAGIFFFDQPFPLMLFVAALYGALFAAPTPEPGPPPKTKITLGRTVSVALCWLVIWIAPLIAIAWLVGDVYSDIAWFFSKLAIVTFGGAYAVLTYMGQEAVSGYGWLETGQMMDGLGLAETTPGPLILVTEFVGFQAGFKLGGAPRLLAGLLGAAVALWATFAPCFLWIFVGAPYVEWLTSRPKLRGALSGVMAAVVGVMLQLTLWFALHVLFGAVTRQEIGPLSFWSPTLSSLDPAAAALAVVSALLLLWRKSPVIVVLAVSAALGLGLRALSL